MGKFEELTDLLVNQDTIYIEKSTKEIKTSDVNDDIDMQNLPQSKFVEIFDILRLKQYLKRAVNLSDCPEFGRRIGCHLTCTFDAKKKQNCKQMFLHHSGTQSLELATSQKRVRIAQEDVPDIESNLNHEVSSKPAIRYVSVRNTLRLDLFRNYKSGCHSDLFVYELPMFQQIDKELCWNYNIGYSGSLPMQEHYLFVSELIKDSILSHNLQKCSLSILPICFCGRYFTEPLFKVGSLLLQSSSTGKEHLSNYQALIKYYVWEQFRPELALNIAMSYLEKQSSIFEAYQSLTEYICLKTYREDPYINIMYGQLEYCMWKLASNYSKKTNTLIKNEWEEDESDLEPVESSSSQFHRQRALSHLSLVEERLGIWDQILPKYIELNKENVIPILQKHLDNNPNNPISYWYLGTILKDIGSDELWDILKKFSAVDVTNDFIKELMIYYKEKEKFQELFDLVVERLDHKSCTTSFFDLEMLHWIVQQRINIVFNYMRSHPNWVTFHFPVPLNKKNVDASKTFLQLKILIADMLQIEDFSDNTRVWLSRFDKTQRLTFSGAAISDHSQLISVSLKSCHEDKLNERLDVSSPEITDLTDSSLDYFDAVKVKKYVRRSLGRLYKCKNIKGSAKRAVTGDQVLSHNESASCIIPDASHKIKIKRIPPRNKQNLDVLFQKSSELEKQKPIGSVSFQSSLNSKREYSWDSNKENHLRKLSGKINKKKSIPDTSNEKNTICKELGFSSLPSASFNVSITHTKTEMNSTPDTSLKTKMNFTPGTSLKTKVNSTPDTSLKTEMNSTSGTSLKRRNNKRKRIKLKNTNNLVSYRYEAVSSLSDTSNSSGNSDEEDHRNKVCSIKNSRRLFVENHVKRPSTMRKVIDRPLSQSESVSPVSDSSESCWDSDKEIQRIKMSLKTLPSSFRGKVGIKPILNPSHKKSIVCNELNLTNLSSTNISNFHVENKRKQCAEFQKSKQSTFKKDIDSLLSQSESVSPVSDSCSDSEKEIQQTKMFSKRKSSSLSGKFGNKPILALSHENNIACKEFDFSNLSSNVNKKNKHKQHVEFQSQSKQLTKKKAIATVSSQSENPVIDSSDMEIKPIKISRSTFDDTEKMQINSHVKPCFVKLRRIEFQLKPN